MRHLLLVSCSLHRPASSCTMSTLPCSASGSAPPKAAKFYSLMLPQSFERMLHPGVPLSAFCSICSPAWGERHQLAWHQLQRYIHKNPERHSSWQFSLASRSSCGERGRGVPYPEPACAQVRKVFQLVSEEIGTSLSRLQSFFRQDSDEVQHELGLYTKRVRCVSRVCVGFCSSCGFMGHLSSVC